MTNYYEVLEIRPTASADEIKKAFRVLAIKYHPDKTNGDEYFAQKFIALSEAYSVLSQPEKRQEYDTLYQQKFVNNSTEEKVREEKVWEEKKREKANEEQFYYEPFKPFYSSRDRGQQETPQFNPVYGFKGEHLSTDSDFFALPKKIGKIIGAYTDLKKQDQPATQSQRTISIVKGFFIGAAIGTFIFFLAKLSNPIWIGVWFIGPIVFSMWIANLTNTFIYTNLFIGVNGFAEFRCQGDRGNITTNEEIHFNEVTDLYIYYSSRKSTGPEIGFVWLNYNTLRTVYVKGGDYKSNVEETEQSIDIRFSYLAERYWTVYLLDKMEETLQRDGYIEFKLCSIDNMSLFPYIKLGIGFITFIKSENQEFTYKFNEIKKIYTKNGSLHVQHNNFERTLYFFKSGNEDVIPMQNLCNRQFFYKAMELLLGYKIV